MSLFDKDLIEKAPVPEKWVDKWMRMLNPSTIYNQVIIDYNPKKIFYLELNNS